jgi:hypothetical protein
MMGRRSLAEGLKTGGGLDPALEEAFVYRDKGKATNPEPPPAPAAEGRDGKGQSASQVGRVPLTIRFRSDFAAVLKRASLQRQLDGVTPHTLQDILEEALEPWLKNNGYLN